MKKASLMLSAAEMRINNVGPIPVQCSDLIDAGSVERGTDSVCFPVSVCLSACLSVCLSLSLSLSLSLCLASPPPSLSPLAPSLSLSHTHTHTHSLCLSVSVSLPSPSSLSLRQRSGPKGGNSMNSRP